MENQVEKLPVTALIPIVDAVADVTKGFVESFGDDGKLTFADLPKFGPVVEHIPAIVGAAKDVLPQLKDVDSEEFKQLVTEYAVHANITNEAAAEKVKAAVDVIISIGDLTVKSITLYKVFKK